MKLSIHRNIIFCCLSIFTILLLISCGGSDSGSGLTGTLNTSLTDSSTEEYRAIYVTVRSVEVHSAEGRWQTVATPGGTYNLLSLVNGVREELGIAPLPAGHYTQMRLIIGNRAEPQATNILGKLHPFANYFIDLNDTAHKLKIPSGFNSGIKIVHGFDINENQTTELILDFDAMKSVVRAGSSGIHLLKPTIKVLRTIDSAILSGKVTDGINGIEGVLVSAQTFSSDPMLDLAQQVQVVRGTITAADDNATIGVDETGEYRLQLLAGNYNMVTYSVGYQPACATLDLTVGTPTVQNFTLTNALTGTVSGSVAITNAGNDQHATIDFRQAGHCNDPATVVNLKTLMIADGGTYTTILPIGDYQVVSSTDGSTTMTVTISVSENATVIHNISL